jgi:hypothetical protein
MDIEWGIGSELEAAPTSATPVPTEMQLRWDTIGEPQTVANGQFLVKITADKTTGYLPQRGLPDGTWIYYSLFVKYEGIGIRSWYEKVSSAYELTPYRYESTEMLWRRIARHWRIQDGMDSGPVPTSSELYGFGPLYRMLDVLGWDLDRMRTLIHYQMVAKDPQLATPENLDRMAGELGIDMKTIDLGTERLRNILNDIGYLRQSKGTISGVREYLTAIAGSDVEIRPVPTNLLTTAQSTFTGTITNTTNASALPLATSNQWIVESIGATATAASGGGLNISRTGTGYELVVAKCRVNNVNQGSSYKMFYDVTNQSGASVIGAHFTPTVFGASAGFIDYVGFGSVPEGGATRRSDGANNWYQAPVSINLAGDGTFTTKTMYLHIYMAFGPTTSSLKLNNITLNNDDRYPYTIDIFSQRANLCRDPQFTRVDSTQWSYTVTGGSASVVRGTKNLSASSGNSASVSFYTTNSTPIRVGIPYYFSLTDSYDNVNKVEIYSTTYGTIASASLPYSKRPYSDGSYRKVWDLTRTYGAPWLPLSLSDCHVKVTCVTSASITNCRISEPLWEYNHPGGEYFDGDNINGGWLSGVTAGTGVADYRWGAAGKSDSFSYYSSDYQRTVATLYRLLDTIIPVTQTGAPESILNLNCIYGYTGATLL